MKGKTARITIELTIDYELPYWDKDRYECYGETDETKCMEYDKEAIEVEVNDLLDSNSFVFGFPVEKESCQWDSKVTAKLLPLNHIALDKAV